jgi:hypothetical protein
MRHALLLAVLAAFSIGFACSCHWGDHDSCHDEWADDDAADDDAGDDDVGDDDTGPPHILDTSRTDCKDGSGPTKDEEWPQSIEFHYENGVLTVTHVNGAFNCCLDYVQVTLQMEGEWTIDLYEQEVASNPCFCVCPFDVTTRIEGMASGSYTVNIYANGAFAVSGQVEVP